MMPSAKRCPSAASAAAAIPTAAFPAATTRTAVSRSSWSCNASRPRAVTRRASTAERAAELMAARCCRRRGLMELIGVGPGGEFRHEVELLKERGHHLTRIVALTELVEL